MGSTPTRGIIALIVAISCLLAIQTNARELPFRPGERLVFKLRWSFIPAGTATLEVLPQETRDGLPMHHFILTARSNAFVDNFYKVRNRIETWTDLALTRSMYYKKSQLEGQRRREVFVRFDWDRNQANYSEQVKNARRTTALMTGTFDPLAAFYFIRTQSMRAGEIIRRPVTDGKKNVIGRATVVRREKIKVRDRIIDTFLLEPELKHVKGVFESGKNSTLQLWVTADQRHIPVKISSKVTVGSFVGELVTDIDDF